MKPRYVLFGVIALAALAFLVIPFVFAVTASGLMVSMPLIVTRNGALLPAEEIKSIEYAFREETTSFERISSGTMTVAKPFQIGFLVDAPFTVTRTRMFGHPTIKPEYRSLTIRLTLTSGTIFTMSVPVLSDTDLNSPIQIDISDQRKKP